jgi:hypothetical protein
MYCSSLVLGGIAASGRPRGLLLAAFVSIQRFHSSTANHTALIRITSALQPVA